MSTNRLKLVLCLIFGVFLFSCTSKYPLQDDLSSHRIACVGDSITYGYKLVDPGKSSYPAKLSRMAKNNWKVNNFGVNGATVISKGDIPYIAQKQFAALKRTAPDVVVIMLGTNDLKNHNWDFIDNFISDYVKLINDIKMLASHPSIVVCSVPPILVNYSNGLNAERQLQVNALIREAADLAGARFLDVNSIFSTDKKYFIDGVHPSSRGTSLIASIVYNEIVKL
jgi:acyl-CoA thioesterase I